MAGGSGEAVAYLAGFEIRGASAPLLRMVGIANALASAGMSVDIIGEGTAEGAEAIRGYLDPGVAVFTLPPPSQLRRVAKATVRWQGNPALSGFVNDHSYSAALAYGSTHAMTTQLGRIDLPPSRKALDVVEFYDPREYLRDWRGWPLTVEHEWQMRRTAPSVGKAIVISSYLESHFRARGARALRVPPIFSPEIRTRCGRAPGPPSFVFAGTVGGKDALTLTNLLVAARELQQDGESLRIHLVGPSRDELHGIVALSALADGLVVAHGRLPHEEAVAVVESSDFSVLQRSETRRVARAGFPSKVVESWMVGTPVLSNLTSDLLDYLEDGRTGIVLVSDSLTAMREGLGAAMSTQPIDRDDLASWATALFSPTTHGGRIADFLLD